MSALMAKECVKENVKCLWDTLQKPLIVSFYKNLYNQGIRICNI